MRVFLLLRGIPASGKSTFIKENNLERFTVESDEIRIAINGLQYNEDGKLTIPQYNANLVWETVDNALQSRMDKGELVILDATNVRKEAYRKYKKLAGNNNYRFFVVDFTPDIETEEEKKKYLEKTKERNNKRPEYKQVPEEVLKKHLNLSVDKSYISDSVLIKPEEYKEKVLYRKYDLNNYNAINLFSDIHGNFTTFQKAIGELKEDEFYILLGDYIDRGFENKEMIEWLFQNADKKNIVYIQGNHERWLKYHAQGKVDNIKSREYLHQTKPDIEDLENWRVKIKYVVKKLQQLYYFEYNNNNYICTHTGVNHFDERIITYSENEITYARGNQDKMAELFKKDLERQNSTNIFNVHGHISFQQENEDEKSPIFKDNVFNINSRVEFGGNLIQLRLTKKEEEIIEHKPEPLKVSEERNTLIKIRRLLAEPEVEVKELNNGILSFAFSREAFYNKIWNESTIQARGLFYKPEENKVIARGYKKFFNYGELYDHDEPYSGTTREEMLELWKKHWSEKLRFPVAQYKKENGFLGLVTLTDKNELYFATKTVGTNENELMLEAVRAWIAVEERRIFTMADLRDAIEKEKTKELVISNDDTGDYARLKIEDDELKVLDYSKSIANFIKVTGEDSADYIHKNGFAKILLTSVKREDLVETLKTNAKNRTLLFEVMDTEYDRHVIKYDKSKVVLLDAVKNSVIEENYLSYEELVKIAEQLNVEVKEKYKDLNTWEDLLIAIEEWKLKEGLEGVVLVDQEHNMFKLKTDYYNKWKRFRNIQDRYSKRTSIPLKTEEEKRFLEYLIENKLATMPLWELRENFEKI